MKPNNQSAPSPAEETASVTVGQASIIASPLNHNVPEPVHPEGNVIHVPRIPGTVNTPKGPMIPAPEAAAAALTYDDCTKADAQAAEQWAVAYVCKVGVSRETMIDAISTLRAQVLTYTRKGAKNG